MLVQIVLSRWEFWDLEVTLSYSSTYFFMTKHDFPPSGASKYISDLWRSRQLYDMELLWNLRHWKYATTRSLVHHTGRLRPADIPRLGQVKKVKNVGFLVTLLLLFLCLEVTAEVVVLSLNLHIHLFSLFALVFWKVYLFFEQLNLVYILNYANHALKFRVHWNFGIF